MFPEIEFQEFSESWLFLLLFESISALCGCVEYVAYFPDRKHFPNLFRNNDCLKMPDFNKDGEKDVGPSVYTLFVLILHLQKNPQFPRLPKKEPAHKQTTDLHVEELKIDLKSPDILSKLTANELQGFLIQEETLSCI